MICRTMNPVQSTNHGGEDDEAYQHLNHAIENGEALNEVFSNLSIEWKSTIIKRKDPRGQNAVLRAIFYRNMQILVSLLSLLSTLQLEHLLLDSDNENNNVIHLALLSDSVDIFEKVWESFKDIHTLSVTDWILQKNHVDQNAFTVALHMPNNGPMLINEYLLPALQLTYQNIGRLLDSNTIVTAVRKTNFELTVKLVKELETHSGGNRHIMLKMLFVDQVHQEQNNNIAAAYENVQQQKTGKNLLELIIESFVPTNEDNINLIVGIFIDSCLSHVNELHTVLVKPLQHNGQRVLSMLINKNCCKLVGNLLKNPWLAKLFWDPMHKYDRSSTFPRHLLEAHPMSAKMVATFNNSRSEFYINLNNLSQARPVCLLFYSEEHTDHRMHRTGAREECASLKKAFEDIRVHCEEMPQNGKVWRWTQLMAWLEQRLNYWKEHTSHMIIVGCCHAADGAFQSPAMELCPVREIIKQANSQIHSGIPITFIFQGCRKPPSVGPTPTLELKKDNLVLMSCLEGQNSLRGVYLKRFVERIRAGERNILRIHTQVANDMAHAEDSRLKDIIPEFRGGTTKFELSLPH